MSHSIEQIEVGRIFLFEQNPRHEPLETQDEVIAQLCDNEGVYEIAAHICKEGLNPMDLPGVIERRESGAKNAKKAYEIWEGNRRICALQLLNDPDKAPAKWRPKFEKLASGFRPIRKINAVVFKNPKNLSFWMDVYHLEPEGISRKKWNADQKARRKGTGRDTTAQWLLDKAEAMGWITPEQRKRRLTTLSRYMTNPEMRSALGLNVSDKTNITTDLTDDDFLSALKRLTQDLLGNEITSRDKAEKHIIPYARALPGKAKLTTGRVEPRSVADVGTTTTTTRQSPGTPKPPKPQRPTPPSPRTKIAVSAELEAAIEAQSTDKVRLLYHSICDVSAEQHTLLIAVGAWAFIECLSATAGRDPDRPFNAYFNNPFLEKLGWQGPKAKRERGVIRDAFERLSRGGNDTKHHVLAGTFDAQQIIADMAIVTPVLTAALKYQSQ